MLHTFSDTMKLSQTLGRFSLSPTSSFIQSPPREYMKPLPPLPPCGAAVVEALRESPTSLAFCAPMPSDGILGRSAKVVLLLEGHDATTYTPAYHPGSIIDGVILVPRPSTLLALDVRILGTIKVDCDSSQELGSAPPRPSEVRYRSYEFELFKELVFFWNSDLDGNFPAKISFRYAIPRHYEAAGERYLLPPSYVCESHDPSREHPFRVNISYEIVIDMLREKESTAFWRKNNGLRVPFMLHHNTRPSEPGPFPFNPSNQSSNLGPQTLFTFKFEPGDLRKPLVKAHVFLPASQVCTLSEPIPFFVTLFGADDDLASFKPQGLSSVTSFHPMDTSTSDTSEGARSPRRVRSTLPVCLKLQRTTIVYTHRSTAFAHTEARIHDTQVIGRGVVQRSTRGHNSVTWTGSIFVDPSLTCGGFDVGRVKVVDSIVLSVNIRDPRSTKDVKKFREVIPMRLTTKPYSCSSAARVTL